MSPQIAPEVYDLAAEQRRRERLELRLNISRIGKFSLDRCLIEEHPKAALAALAGCIVLHAEFLHRPNVIEYVALCADFDISFPPNEVPRYAATMRRTSSGEITRLWQRV